MHSRSGAALLVLVMQLWAVSACDPPVPENVPPPWSLASDYELQVGGGAWAAFTPRQEGEPLLLERGPQGGQHVAYSVRARGVEAGATVDILAWLVERADEAVLGAPQRSLLALSAPDPILYETPPPADVVETLALIFFIPDPPAVLGRTGELRIQATLDDGRVGRVAAWGTVQWAPDESGEPPDLDAGPGVDGDAGSDADGGTPPPDGG